MARSNAATLEEHLVALPRERRAVVSAVHDVILRNLPSGRCGAALRVVAAALRVADKDQA